ncbi:hypothetical protein CK503_13390 [Aliifodinibius salipaludis]|uniref:DUF4175 domain-containing protein n=1 Tax=Fodinibius salipaludis TaxID=2032627 RepID=A0A2A2G8I9_9BACT|nr:DUF4175 family protein [Aliifodinibius salipaludis]PAU93147.1 hypothetical protein CK503_13390 [Aliifodinibius salipaludis]
MSKEQSTDKLVRPFVDIIRQRHQSLSRNFYIALTSFFAAILLVGFTIIGIFEAGYYLESTIKISTLSVLLVTAVTVTLYFYKRRKLPSFKDMYYQFGREEKLPELTDALDLYYNNQDDNALHKAAIEQNLSKLNSERVQEKLRQYAQNHPLHRFFKQGVISAVGGFLILSLFTFFYPTAIERLANPQTTFTPPNPYNFVIDPGSLTLEHGNSFSPTIRFQDNVPEDIMLAFKTDIEDNYRRRSPEALEQNRATFAPISLTTDGRYYVIMDGFESKKYDIDVQLRPRFEQLTLHIIPPAYTQLDSTSYSYPFSKIQAYEGSTIEIEGLANKKLSELLYISSNLNDTLSASRDSTRENLFTIKTKVGAVDTISFRMRDSAGLTNENNFRFIVDPRKDQSPYVDLIAPSENLRMKSAKPLSLEYEASDDFGLTEAKLHYELQRAFTPEPEKGTLELPPPTINEEQSYQWDLPNLNPKARDQITYWIEVYDNDRYNGRKKGRSQKMTVTFPSTTEYMEELDSKEREVTESLEDVSQSFEQMEKQYEQFKQQLQQNPETDWEQKQKLEEVEKERQEIDKKVDDLNQKFEEIRNEIEQNQAMSPETLEAYDELQKLMKEINDPELEKALEELRNSLGEMNPDEMRKALENYEFNEEQYRQRIDRTLDLFKSLKLNSDLEKAAQSLEELAKQEKEISEEREVSDEEVQQQQSIQEDLSDLQEQLDNIDDNAPDNAKPQVEKLQQKSSKQLDKIEKELQENINKLKEQSSPEKDIDIKKQQQNIQQQLQQQAQQMRSAKQQLNQQRRQVNRAALEYVLHSLINLSKNQEELTKETEPIPTQSSAFVEKARQERNISNQFTILSDSLFKVSSEIPSFSNQINKKKTEVEQSLSRAVELLAERDGSNATYAQRQSLGGINELTTMITSLLDQLNNQQGGGSGGAMSMQQLMEQMKKMSGEQQQINKQIQEMINDMQGNRLSQDQMERLNQLSKQQNKIRKQLRELQRRGQLESGDRVLSELERMSEQMEDAINDLRGGQLDKQLMQRQQNILSRMLNAEKAVQERGKEERREATTAEEREQRASPDVTLEELQKQVRDMINNPDYTSFSDDYQRLIEHYFELLKKYEN